MSLFEELTKKNKDPNFHFGRFFVECMKKKSPDEIFQIDAWTNEEETYASVWNRSVRLAKVLREMGLQPGDVLAFGGRNHLDIHIPYYAALLNGLPILGVDPYFKYDEIKALFKLAEPKIAFCQREMYDDYKNAAEEVGIETKIVTFDGDGCTMSQLIKDDTGPICDFQPSSFDREKVYAWLVSTSGSTGVPKVAAFKHNVVIDQILMFMRIIKRSDNSRSNTALNLAPVQWISSYFNAISMLISDHCKLQTSNPNSIDHVIDMINKYKPATVMLSPYSLTSILKSEKPCDLTCFETVTVTGSKVYKEMLSELKKRLHPNALLLEAYGQTETLGPCLRPNPMGPIGNCGVPMPTFAIKLIDPDTGNEVTEPNVPGEMWVKGPSFTEYYKNSEETAKAFTEDGWYRTGDLLCKDENNNYFFVDRIKMLIKYRNYHVNPPELEEVISAHEGVLDVSVVGIPDPEDGQRPVACVVRKPGCDVSAQDIKDLVANKLSSSKQLRGGVVFLDELPRTSTGKVARAKLNDIVQNAHKE